MSLPRSKCCSFILITCICLSVHFLAAQFLNITIVEHPSSLLVPLNATAVFSCTAQCNPSPCELMGQWVINDMFVSICHNHDTLTMTLMINTSEARNISKVRCYFDLNIIPPSPEHKDSDNATLILIDDVPFFSNPLLTINISHINLTWAPPFLWPGHAIQYFNVSFTNKSDGSVTYHTINNSFGDRIVSFVKETHEELLICTEINVNISAISNYSFGSMKQPLQLFSVADKILPLPNSFNLSKVITSNIHFRCDENDVVDLELSIQLQLPKVACNNQEVNSTFILKNDHYDLIAIVTGPFLHNGSSAIIHNLSYILDTNQTYSLTIQIEYGSHVIATTTHQLDTFIDLAGCEEYSITTKSMKLDIEQHHDDGLIDYLLMGGSLTLVVFTILTVITGYYFCYYRKKTRECRFEELRARIQDSLMNNPIYNPMPVYEQILPQTTSENRYIDQPMHVQNGLEVTDSTKMFEHNDPISQNVSDTTEASTATPSVHSSFHPTLTLDTNDDSINNSTGLNDGKECTWSVDIYHDNINNSTGLNDGKEDTQAVDTNDDSINNSTCFNDGQGDTWSVDINNDSISNSTDFNDGKGDAWSVDTNDDSIKNLTGFNDDKEGTRAVPASVTQIKQEAETLETSDTD